MEVSADGEAPRVPLDFGDLVFGLLYDVRALVATVRDHLLILFVCLAANFERVCDVLIVYRLRVLLSLK